MSTRPAVSSRHVRRPRLTRVLDAARGQAVVLVAPAGYGKTMLAAEWAQEREGVAWYRAVAPAADLAAFSVGVAAVLAQIVSGAGARLERRLRVGESPETAARPLAELLAEDLADWPDDAWLVIDDYHLVADSAAVEEFIDWLLALAPVRLLVTTRRRPAWASARRILYGEVLELTREELAMTADEAASVLEGHSSDAIRALLEQAQGWPAVIGLAGLSASLDLPRARIADALYRYFAEEVFRSEPPDVQRLMLRAAVPVSIDARTAADVLGIADGDAAIERLVDEGLLHEAGGERKRFHPLLRDFLLRKLEAEEPGARPRLSRAVIDDARAAGRWEEAFELAVESGQLEAAAEIAAERAAELVESGRIETIERWLAACGAAADEHPALVVARIEVLLRRGELVEASALASRLARRLTDDDPQASAAWHLAGRAHHLLSEDAQGLDCHLRACKAAKTRHDLTNALWGATVLAAQLESELLEELVRSFETAAAGDLDSRLRLASAKLFLASRRGSLAGIWRTLEPLMPLVDRATDPMARDSFLIAAGYLNVARADYRLASHLIGKAVETVHEFRLGRIKLAFCLAQRVAADIGLRRFERAEETLRELAELGLGRTDVLVLEQRNLRAKLMLATGRADEIVREADFVAHAETGPRASLGEHAGLLAVAAAAVGDGERSRLEAERARTLTGGIEARLYARLAELVLCADGNGGGDGAGDAAAFVEHAAEHECLDAVVVGYRVKPELLESAARDPAARAVVAGLLEASNDHVLARRHGVAATGRSGEPDGGGLAMLTPRENEVLKLIAAGLGNAEIAKRLFISEKTAKVHVYHIFEKLGVATRVQAVLAAQQLLAPDQ